MKSKQTNDDKLSFTLKNIELQKTCDKLAEEQDQWKARVQQVDLLEKQHVEEVNKMAVEHKHLITRLKRDLENATADSKNEIKQHQNKIGLLEILCEFLMSPFFSFMDIC
jgi:biopolymer transport protein ExbB/TolQ